MSSLKKWPNLKRTSKDHPDPQLFIMSTNGRIKKKDEYKLKLRSNILDIDKNTERTVYD